MAGAGRRLRGALLLALLAAAPAHAASPAEGRWRTPKGEVELYACGVALCGRLLDAEPIRADPAARDVRNRDAALRDRRPEGSRLS